MSVSIARRNCEGSWFSTGFHGHFRSKTRLDFNNAFRNSVKPKPPKKFIQRMKNAHNHSFSSHDNRHGLIKDAAYFEQGLGRRRIDNAVLKGHPKILSWCPEEEAVVAWKNIYEESVYRHNYRSPDGCVVPKQILLDRSKDESDSVSVYRQTFDNKSISSFPSVTQVNDPKTYKVRRKINVGSVAECLVWNSFVPRKGAKCPTINTNSTYRMPEATSVTIPLSPPKKAISCSNQQLHLDNVADSKMSVKSFNESSEMLNNNGCIDLEKDFGKNGFPIGSKSSLVSADIRYAPTSTKEKSFMGNLREISQSTDLAQAVLAAGLAMH